MTARATSDQRLPDFIIVGTMKSATTSIFRWLASVPEIRLPAIKEPAFFALDDRWERGVESYAELFAGIPNETKTGEASVVYTDPIHSTKVANRMAEILPDVRLICSLREPISRMRSHYLHEVQRGRERRPFAVAIGDLGSPYVRRSSYATALRPYFERFGEDQLLISRMPDIIAAPHPGWHAILRHLDVAPIDPPAVVMNRTDQKPRFNNVTRALWERGFLNAASRRSPLWLRKIGRTALSRKPGWYVDLLTSSEAEVSASVDAHVQRELAELMQMTGITFE